MSTTIQGARVRGGGGVSRAAIGLAVGLGLALGTALPAQTRSPYSRQQVEKPIARGGEGLCPSYADSVYYRARSRTLRAGPGDWLKVIDDARDGDEILLEDGVYRLSRYSLYLDSSITIRSASGRRDRVIIEGPGYGPGGEGLTFRAPDATIADLTITQFRNHGIAVKGERGADRAQIYNVHVYDIGTQHIKGTRTTIGGLVACSRIGYSPGAVRGDYINGIDIHGAIEWTVVDNYLYNIWGDGTGCEVDRDCGRYLAGGGPAILLWRDARDNVVERNRIVDSFRGIALGMGSAHPGGIVRNNFFYQSEPGREGARGFIGGDMGIQVDFGEGTQVDHNTVILGGSYRGAIEVRRSTNVDVRNNLLTRPVWNRDGSTYNGCSTDACDDSLFGNLVDATADDLAVAGEPHLAAGSSAVDSSVALLGLEIGEDIDGDSRPAGVGPDVGCDERVVPGQRTRERRLVE